MTEQEYLLPFLWMRGEDEQTLRQGLRSVAESGCGSVCVESRVHPDYLGPAWWRDLDVVTQECRSLGLTYYVLDDAHFPSGYANGAAKGTRYCRKMVTERHMDVCGPRKGGALSVWPDGEKGELVAVIAARRLETGTLRRAYVDIGGWALSDLTDLTDRVQDGLIRWDVPEGIWRVLVLTANYVSERNPPQFFVNPLLPEGGRLMLDTVYEAHYARLGAEFGKTFAGFFSDEPALRAGRGSHAVLGEYPMLPIPWRDDLPTLLSARMGCDARALLPGLWYDIGTETSRVRYAFMNLVSELYGQNYSSQIGAWCIAHGVEYIGHVIEQGDAHSRLGQGAGHYFRAVSGQTMSGMDYVLHELRPEFRGGFHAWKSQDFEAEDDFFRYMLPQMTVSAAQLDPKKMGRALCEIFGAYGWQEDLGEMRYLANLLLSRGVNRFTPHAFNLAPFPDPDSPPHFGPFNPQMPGLKRLFSHMNRAAAQLDGGRMVTKVGALYYAEGEWACGSGVMKTQQIVRELNRRQIPCLVVPVDELLNCSLHALLIPRANEWPAKLYQALKTLTDSGCHVAFMDEPPIGVSEGEADIGSLLKECKVVPLNQAAAWTAEAVHQMVRACEPYPDVQLYVYEKRGQTVYALFNECADESRVFRAEVDGITAPVIYDTEMQTCTIAEACPCEGGRRVTVRLDPGQLLLLGDPRPDWPDAAPPLRYIKDAPIMPRWTVSFPGGEFPSFVADESFDLTKRFPRFAGTVRCECEIALPKGCCGFIFPDAAGETRAELNGEEIGERLSPPYRFFADASGMCRLAVETTTTLFPRCHDPLSFFNYIMPIPLAGSVIPLLRASFEHKEAVQ